VLLLFYHETPEWPTRLNEVYVYTYNITYSYIYIMFVYIWHRRNYLILIIYNLVLLLFYHETPEWPTRLNEVYLYVCIYLFMYVCVSCFGIYIWHRRQPPISTVYSLVLLLLYHQTLEWSTRLNEVYINVCIYVFMHLCICLFMYIHHVYIYIYIYIYRTVAKAQYWQFIMRCTPL